ncbi:putative mannosyltransferase NDAI_0G00740 [Naumovozyma dairenensis CBS 421]|uniref:Mannosyltransferase n=1 Tax=Naumovozyma dairenensis (strain ATCC 10597 / BCRC 20456 / CBS 421 / NBRC 0211 / NRRL Y-12639) TaxID=1071378 RepID=G0WDI9_NAUDC|nr:hypothetical protein NDAI_0G00740 [Naumovozyma dairenensis CBS 421]CCD25850.2 hypothetical protein NDAI_0G00740 [Naumovozyma dairenensis CBS 421]
MLKRILVRKILPIIARCNPIVIIILISFITTILMIKSTLDADAEPQYHPLAYSFQDLSTKMDSPFFYGCTNTHAYINENPTYYKMNATFVMLTRNEELNDVLKTIRSIESHFNQWFHYPYVFLNDEPFTQEFMDKIRSVTTTMNDDEVYFGQLNELEWEFAQDVRESVEYIQWIDSQGDRGILYGNMESYHKMCRFYSGLFYKHPLVRQFEWYWRLEPDVEFFCDLSYDPFWEMERTKKYYGFTVVIPELYWTVPNLFRFVKSFVKERQSYVKFKSLWKLFATNYHYKTTNEDDPYNTNLNRFVNDDDELHHELSRDVAIENLFTTHENETIRNNNTHADSHLAVEKSWKSLIEKSKSKIPIKEDKFDDEEYNLCHFWSNFEIAKISIFDNEIYDEFFQYLESTGGFWKERWGDAPIHSLGLSLILNLNEVHYFRDIGYRHSQIYHCPRNSFHSDNERFPFIEGDEKYKRNKKANTYDRSWEHGTGCRCKCPRRLREIEDTMHHCFELWLELTHNLDTYGSDRENIDVTNIKDKLRKDFLEKFINA